MNEEVKAGWDPESDPEYAQRLAPYLAGRYRWWLLAGFILGGLVLGVISLFLPSEYSAVGSLQVNNDVSTGSRLTSLLGGGPSSALQDEMLILGSREIGLGVIDELGLQVKVYDPRGADSPWQRVVSKLMPGGDPVSRAELYTRLTVRDIEVSEELLKEKELWITADEAGNWRIGQAAGAPGDCVIDDRFNFLPVFGSAHRAGYRYKLTVQPDYIAWKHYRENLKITPAEDDANIIAVKFTHPNPVVAKGVVDEVIDRYLEYNQQSTYGDFDVLLSFIDEEAAKSEDRINALTDELREYQEQHAVFNPTSQSAEAITRIGELNKARTSLQIDMKQIDRQLGLLADRSLDEFCQTTEPVGGDPALGGEFTNLGNLVRALELARETKTDEHPDVVQLLKNIDITVEQLKESLTANRHQLEIAYGELAGDVSTYRGQLEALPAASSRISLLTAELSSHRQVLNLLTEQKAQTLLSRAGTSLKVRLLDEPPMPAKRDSPKIVKNGVIGAVAGLFVVIVILLVRESQNRNFKSLRELRLGVGLRVLGVLPEKSPRGGWRPREIDTDETRRLAKFLTADTNLIGVIQATGPAGGYDLAWTLAGRLGTEARPGLIIDVDNLEAGLARALEVAEGPGLAEVAAATGSAGELAGELEGNRRVLGPGTGRLDTETLDQCLTELRELYAVVVCCLPPPALWTDTTRNAAKAIGRVVVSVPQGSVSTAELCQVVGDINGDGCSIAGAVVTHFRPGRDYLGRQELRFVTIRPDTVS